MAAFSQWSEYDLLYTKTFDQLLYWYELALYQKHGIDPMKNYDDSEEHGDVTFTKEMFRDKYQYDNKLGWIRK